MHAIFGLKNAKCKLKLKHWEFEAYHNLNWRSAALHQSRTDNVIYNRKGAEVLFAIEQKKW